MLNLCNLLIKPNLGVLLSTKSFSKDQNSPQNKDNLIDYFTRTNLFIKADTNFIQDFVWLNVYMKHSHFLPKPQYGPINASFDGSNEYYTGYLIS